MYDFLFSCNALTCLGLLILCLEFVLRYLHMLIIIIIIIIIIVIIKYCFGFPNTSQKKE
jgi:hypothetical protein